MDEPALGALADYLSAQRGEPTAVLAARRLSVGHSRAMYRVDTDGGSFVVRVEQGGVFGTSSGEEFGVMQGLARAGFPVAPARWYEPTGSVLGRPFFVMDFVEGAELPDERAMDEATAADFVRTMADLHALDWQSAGIDEALAVRPTTPDEAHPPPDRAVGRALPRRRGRAHPAPGGGRGLAPPPRPAARAAVGRPRRRRPGQRGPGRWPDRRGDRLGVRPPGRSGRGLVVLPVDAGIADAARGTHGWSCSTASPASAWTRPGGATGRPSTSSRGRAPTAPASTCSSAVAIGHRTWPSSGPCCTVRSCAGS